MPSPYAWRFCDTFRLRRRLPQTPGSRRVPYLRCLGGDRRLSIDRLFGCGPEAQWPADWHGRCVRLDAHTTKNDEGRVFPFTVDLEKILTEQLAIHDRLKAADTICPFVFHRNGERIGYFRTAWKNACKAAGLSGRAGPRHAPVCRRDVRARRRPAVRRHVDRRPQDGVDLSTRRDRGRSHATRSGGSSRCLDGSSCDSTIDVHRYSAPSR
jgi:hypothetical protein